MNGTDHGDNRAVGEAVVSTVNEDGSWDIPEPDHAELVQMRIRLITLENIVLGLLSGASDEQIDQIGCGELIEILASGVGLLCEEVSAIRGGLKVPVEDSHNSKKALEASSQIIKLRIGGHNGIVRRLR